MAAAAAAGAAAAAARDDDGDDDDNDDAFRFCAPLLLCLFADSLGGPESFARFKATIAHPLVKLILLGLLWAYVHHFCAGIRFLALDLHKGLDLPTARKTAGAVLVVSLLLTVIIGVKLW